MPLLNKNKFTQYLSRELNFRSEQLDMLYGQVAAGLDLPEANIDHLWTREDHITKRELQNIHRSLDTTIAIENQELKKRLLRDILTYIYTNSVNHSGYPVSEFTSDYADSINLKEDDISFCQAFCQPIGLLTRVGTGPTSNFTNITKDFINDLHCSYVIERNPAGGGNIMLPDTTGLSPEEVAAVAGDIVAACERNGFYNVDPKTGERTLVIQTNNWQLREALSTQAKIKGFKVDTPGVQAKQEAMRAQQNHGINYAQIKANISHAVRIRNADSTLEIQGLNITMAKLGKINSKTTQNEAKKALQEVLEKNYIPKEPSKYFKEIHEAIEKTKDELSDNSDKITTNQLNIINQIRGHLQKIYAGMKNEYANSNSKLAEGHYQLHHLGYGQDKNRINQAKIDMPSNSNAFDWIAAKFNRERKPEDADFEHKARVEKLKKTTFKDAPQRDLKQMLAHGNTDENRPPIKKSAAELTKMDHTAREKLIMSKTAKESQARQSPGVKNN